MLVVMEKWVIHHWKLLIETFGEWKTTCYHFITFWLSWLPKFACPVLEWLKINFLVSFCPTLQPKWKLSVTPPPITYLYIHLVVILSIQLRVPCLWYLRWLRCRYCRCLPVSCRCLCPTFSRRWCRTSLSCLTLPTALLALWPVFVLVLIITRHILS